MLPANLLGWNASFLLFEDRNDLCLGEFAAAEKLFLSFQLSERIAQDNFYRRLRETLDLQSIYSDTRDLYGRTGNPSINRSCSARRPGSSLGLSATWKI